MRSDKIATCLFCLHFFIPTPIGLDHVACQLHCVALVQLFLATLLDGDRDNSMRNGQTVSGPLRPQDRVCQTT